VPAEIQHSDFLKGPEKMFEKMFGQNPAGSWNIHISSVPTKSFSHIAFICAEKMNF
jgi:hypothetical protein